MRVKRGRLAVGGAMLACAITAPAQAASLVNRGGTLTYAAGAGTSTSVSFSQSGPGAAVKVRRQGEDPIAVSGCDAGADAFEYMCAGVNAVVADAGDGDDSFVTGGLHVPATLYGGPGDDYLHGGGEPAVTLDGGPGDDHLYPGDRGDTVIGGTGIDTASYYIGSAMTISLDGVANDGAVGAGLNFAADIEDVEPLFVGYDLWTAAASHPVTLTGSAGSNRLTTAGGDDHLAGGAGEDTLTSADGNDTIDARDGYGDRVDCGLGVDTANVDQFDLVSASCENTVTTTTASATEDRPPVIVWADPAARATLSGNTSTTLRVDVSDDRGVRTVRFMDDDRELCLDAVAPFTCTYRPRGDDVGRNTLTAIATDASGQTASVVRAVIVGRLTPRAMTLRVSRAGIATGKLRLPAGCHPRPGLQRHRRRLRPPHRAQTRVHLPRAGRRSPAIRRDVPRQPRSHARAVRGQTEGRGKRHIGLTRRFVARAEAGMPVIRGWRRARVPADARRARLSFSRPPARRSPAGGRDQPSCCSSRASASAIFSISARSTDSFAAWMRARSESCAPQRTNAASG